VVGVSAKLKQVLHNFCVAHVRSSNQGCAPLSITAVHFGASPQQLQHNFLVPTCTQNNKFSTLVVHQ
jgi:hypothetical protein